ncbi:hypothetical protein [Actinomadura sp. B10D3]|uniref:hypothetical protein n=1 Tax=Actinomadura sp. B10D3 TaxID=3153557 RepID=UPI00325D657D
MSTNRSTSVRTVTSPRTELAEAPSGHHDLDGELRTDIDRGNAIDAVEASFGLLVQGPSPLCVDGAEIGHGLPARSIGLREMRAILLHPSTGYAARDAVWAQLVSRARHDGPAWVVGCLGIALPGLKATLARVTSGCGWQEPHRIDEAAAAMVSAFHQGLLTIDIDRKAIGPRLLLRARKAAYGAGTNGSPLMQVAPESMAETVLPPVTQRPAGHVDLVLAEAVRQGVLSRFEASVIGVTRFEDVDPRQLAEQLGTGYEALMKRRRRAERRLGEAIQAGDLAEISELMSNPGS